MVIAAYAAIDVVVNFLRPFDAEAIKNAPPLISQFAVQRASGADLAPHFYKLVAIDEPMPDGGRNQIEVAVASIPALLKASRSAALTSRRTP